MSEAPEIESAIALLCNSPTPDNRVALYRTLRDGELFILVGEPPGEHLAPEVKLPKDTVMSLLTTTSPEGKPAVLAFTSLNHLRRRSPAAAAFTKLPTARVLDLVMNGTYEALVLNAAGPWASIPRADVEVIRGTLAPPVVPPVDLSVPVTNPRLIAAIEKHQRAQSKQTAEELFGELRKAVFLVAIILDKPPVEVSEGQSLFNIGDKISVVEVRDNKDSRLLALFTDHTELQRFTYRANSTLVMPTKDAMSFTLDKDYSGFVVNPAGEATFRLDSAFIGSVIGGM